MLPIDPPPTDARLCGFDHLDYAHCRGYFGGGERHFLVASQRLGAGHALGDVLAAQAYRGCSLGVHPVRTGEQQRINRFGGGFGRGPRLGAFLLDEPLPHFVDKHLIARGLGVGRLLPIPSKGIAVGGRAARFQIRLDQIRLCLHWSLIPVRTTLVIRPVHAQFVRNSAVFRHRLQHRGGFFSVAESEQRHGAHSLSLQAATLPAGGQGGNEFGQQGFVEGIFSLIIRTGVEVKRRPIRHRFLLRLLLHPPVFGQ